MTPYAYNLPLALLTFELVYWRFLKNSFLPFVRILYPAQSGNPKVSPCSKRVSIYAQLVFYICKLYCMSSSQLKLVYCKTQSHLAKICIVPYLAGVLFEVNLTLNYNTFVYENNLFIQSMKTFQ